MTPKTVNTIKNLAINEVNTVLLKAFVSLLMYLLIINKDTKVFINAILIAITADIYRPFILML